MISRTISTKINFDAIPPELRELRQWVCWRFEDRTNGRGELKRTKVPYVPSGRNAETDDPGTWCTFDDAKAAFEHGGFDGIGYVFAKSDPYVGIDLDACIDETGAIMPWAAAIVAAFASYTEVSPSGTGVKIWARGSLPAGIVGKGTGTRRHTLDGVKLPTGCAIEMYQHGRYFAMTGQQWPGTQTGISDANDQVHPLWTRITKRAENKGKSNSVENVPPSSSNDTHRPTDADIIAKLQAGKQADKFKALWNGDTSGYSDDHSSADQALCNLLAFYSGPDRSRIDALFRQSGLLRDKWTEREDYRSTTIGNAISGCREFYTWQRNGQSNGHVERNGVHNLWTPAGRTDAANAARFVARYGDSARWCDPHGAWYVWQGTHWEQDRKRAVEAMAAKLATELWAEVKKATDPRLVVELVKFAKSSNSAFGIRNMLTMARSLVPVLPENFDVDSFSLNCPDGTLDLLSGKLRPHRREDFITKLCPTRFNPDASSLAWDRFLEAIFGGQQDVIDFMRRFVGYCLTGDVREQLVAIFHGGGSNGKSTFIKAITDTLGGDFTMYAPRGFLMATKNEKHSTEQYDLRGRRLVAAVETGDGKRLDEELIKSLTGGEPVRARKMYADNEQFAATHKLVICTNHKPRIRGLDHAVWRRIALVPFTVKFWNPAKEETGPAELVQDKGLSAKLAAEAEGILAWAVRGCLEWQRDGLLMPKAVTAATEGYRSSEDVMGRFVEACCVRCESQTPFGTLYEALQAWCDEGGDNLPSRKGVAAWLDDNGFQREMSRARPYRGIALLSDARNDHNDRTMF